jgi:hypothetical protein
VADKKKLTAHEKSKLAEAYARAKDAGRRAYAKMDKLLDQLLAGGLEPGEKIELKSGRVAELKDNFASKNKHFKSAGVCRYELDFGYADEP